MNYRDFSKKAITIFLCLFLFFQQNVKAHQDVFWIKHFGNVHCEFMSGRLAVHDKLMIFFKLAEKLQKKHFAKSPPICIYFDHDYTCIDSAQYALGYGRIDNFIHTLNKPKADSGILLSIRDRDIDIKKLLNLVNAAYENLELLKKNKSLIYFSGFYRKDSINSLDNNLIEKFTTTESNNVEELLKEQIFRKDASQGFIRDTSIDFYFQNNKFNFYYTQNPNFYDSSKGPQSVIISLDNFFETVEYQSLHFIFSSDSTFYLAGYSSDNKSTGPYLISNMETGRKELSEIYFQRKPLRCFTFLFDYYSHDSKVLFIPDSNLVISDYDKIEQNFVSDYLKKNKKVKSKVDDRIVLLSFLLISVILNAIFILRKKA